MVRAWAKRVRTKDDTKSKKAIAADIVLEYLINALDMAMVYVSPDPYGMASEEELSTFNFNMHCTAGYASSRKITNSYSHLWHQAHRVLKSLTGEQKIQGVWLIQIDDILVTSIADSQAIFQRLYSNGTSNCTLIFSHPES